MRFSCFKFESFSHLESPQIPNDFLKKKDKNHLGFARNNLKVSTFEIAHAPYIQRCTLFRSPN